MKPVCALCMCCEELDRCASGLSDCDPYAACVNVRQGVNCACLDPYQGNGTYCEGSKMIVMFLR